MNNCESVCLKMDEELVDDVFEDDLYNPKNYYQNTNTGLSFSEATFLTEETPSPTGIHPGFRTTNTKLPNGDNDGWKSFKIDDDNEFDENTLHKVRAEWRRSWIFPFVLERKSNIFIN